VHTSESAASEQSSAKDDKLELCHHRLGHLNIKSVKILCGTVSGMDLLQLHADLSSFTYESCIEGKQQQLPFAGEATTRATEPLKIIHSNVYGVTDRFNKEVDALLGLHSK
jgi:hypothetical protein